MWTVADDRGQAREDLVREWSSERRPTWAIDTALPGQVELDQATLAVLPVDDRVRAIALVGAQTRLVADAARAALPPDPRPKLEAATAVLAGLRQQRADLEAGTGAYAQTQAGQAVRDLRASRVELRSAEHPAQHGRGWRDRHSARRRLPALIEAANDAERRWDALVAPEMARLDGEVASAETVVGQVNASGNAIEQSSAS